MKTILTSLLALVIVITMIGCAHEHGGTGAGHDQREAGMPRPQGSGGRGQTPGQAAMDGTTR